MEARYEGSAEHDDSGYPAETLEGGVDNKGVPDFLSEVVRDTAMKRLNFFGE
ncbi:MAG: hypothetical protein AAB739_03620 [Patescibacteria group bacterium]